MLSARLKTLPTSRLATLTLALLILAGSARSAAANWPTNGTSGLPVCTNTSGQDLPNICSDGAGGAFIAWFDARPGGGIFGQHLNALGQPLWAANGIKLGNANAQYQPAMCPDGTGGFFLMYTSADDLFAQRVNAAGSPMWGASGITLCNAPSGQYPGKVFPDGAGGAVFGWADRRAGSFSIRLFAQRVNAAGGIQWPLNGAPADLTPQQIGDYAFAGDGAGGIFLSWDLGSQLWIQKLDAAGNQMWGSEGINVALGPSWTNHSSLVYDGAGGAIIQWWDARSPTPDDQFAKRYGPTGTQLWSPSTGAPMVQVAGSQRWSNMVSDGAGGVIAAWLDFRPGGATHQIYAQRLDPSGAPVWTVNGVQLTVTPGLDHQYMPIAMAADGQGGAVMAWTDFRTSTSNPDIRIARVGPGGVSPWGNDGVIVCSDPGFQYSPAITTDGSGAALVAWADYRSGTPFDIYASRVDATGVFGPPLPTAALVSLASTNVTAERVQLAWYATGSAGLAATLERSTGGLGWQSVAALSVDGAGRMSYEDTDVIAGGRYGYRLRLTQDGSSWTTSESWFDVPSLTFALEGVRPLPSIGPATVWLRLPDDKPATLELFDVRGRRVMGREVGALGAGRHQVSFAKDGSLTPGVYLVRLSRQADVQTSRMVVLDR
jgi:hypothetical protein